MAVQDHIGRIDKEAFLVSLGFFLALAIIGVAGRFVIRFGIQKDRLQIDDGLLVIACVFLLASQIIIYCRVVDPMFLMTAIQFGVQGVEVPLNVIQIAEDYHRWTVASLMLSWCAISIVKFFFLIFFKRLIDRLRPWQIYWWVVFGYNIVLISFGITVYYASCPFWGAKGLQCATGVYEASLVRYSAGQICLDIVGDLLILAIPAGLIWKIQVNWRQKLVLACSLCLTIVLVTLSITRVAGIKYKGYVDSVWETYWQSMSAELGVFLAAASAFRAFFVSQKQNKRQTPGYNQALRSPEGKPSMGSDQKQNGILSDVDTVDTYGRLDDPEWNFMTSTVFTETEMTSTAQDPNTGGSGYVKEPRVGARLTSSMYRM